MLSAGSVLVNPSIQKVWTKFIKKNKKKDYLLGVPAQIDQSDGQYHTLTSQIFLKLGLYGCHMP